MQYTINSLYKDIFSRLTTIRDIFNNFFGEEYVDLQLPNTEKEYKDIIKGKLSDAGIELTDYDTSFTLPENIKGNLRTLCKGGCIYVHWPAVTVTNEYDKSIDIQDLYAKITLQIDGTIPYECAGFLLNRSTYTEDQFEKSYLHSHIRDIPYRDYTKFMEPCLGTGPIKNTIVSLKSDYDEALWMLFCQELSMYVTVESLLGVPWHKLEDVGNNKNNVISSYFFRGNCHIRALRNVLSDDEIKKFIVYYLKHGHLSLSYNGHKFVLGMDYLQYILDLTNCFIDGFNIREFTLKDEYDFLRLRNSGILNSVIIDNGKIYIKQENDIHRRNQALIDEGKRVLTFKGKDVCLKIIKAIETKEYDITLLNSVVANYILEKILNIINCRYVNTKARNNQASTSSVGEKVLYL